MTVGLICSKWTSIYIYIYIYIFYTRHNINVNDVLGDFALTLVDTLDTLAVIKRERESMNLY
jgi:hypothetical protein